MSKQYSFLWLDGVFDENTVNNFPSLSPASNFWQRGFVEALLESGNNVDIIGHTHERIWPYGRLIISGDTASFPESFSGSSIGYLNAPFLRGMTRFLNYLMAVKSYFSTSSIPDYSVTFSCLSKSSDTTASINTAKYIRRKFGVPWICIVADGLAPAGADRYIYLTWKYYESLTAPGPKIHIDGGVPVIGCSDRLAVDFIDSARKKSLMYMGALTLHGGATQLAKAFHTLNGGDIELWICGRGENTELSKLAKIDKRIKLFGFVSEEKLCYLASNATAFVNPRPTNFEPNKLNYPSKLLHYLAYGKPLISTITEGISPEYSDVLMPIPDDSNAGLSEAIQTVLNLNENDYNVICNRIAIFNKNHAWSGQVNRFISWL